jgi:hypothetical protein
MREVGGFHEAPDVKSKKPLKNHCPYPYSSLLTLSEPSWVVFCASKKRVALPTKNGEQGGERRARESKAFPVQELS